MTGGRTLDPEPWEASDGRRGNWGTDLRRAMSEQAAQAMNALTFTYAPRTVNFASTPGLGAGHSPRDWFTPGVYPWCECGYAPGDNRALMAHWRENGGMWRDNGGHLERRGRAHEANPILVDARQASAEWLSWFLREYNHDTDSWVWDRTPEQVAHARRVLTRLAEWKETA